ncbi:MULTISPECIES: DUF2510 domain-containing protein [unclassified Leifsonia]|uniref:DUF2510 domain-containing protein n=1 Tax=unclassified Leifsonia TaxID=2663824 RepID=UPI0006FD91CA|nr:MULTISPECIES: DUF2510 domain-containing protein [unclassified Leifsonia]KQX06516.1 hypothetical protein ASC59_01225 [Leifsonia sp. Root1293]KRA10799.1 hypothetical protein ASD61_01225 [Leifsonia sp. Root60]
MTSHPQSSIDAGWFADPYDPSGLVLRWWDGTQWTAQTHRADVVPGATAPREGAPLYTIWIWALVILPLLSSLTIFTIDFRAYLEDAMRVGTMGRARARPP